LLGAHEARVDRHPRGPIDPRNTFAGEDPFQKGKNAWMAATPTIQVMRLSGMPTLTKSR